jgi:hypothetical protein
MRVRLAAATFAALLLPAAPAAGGDPIMPLSEVRSGMECTAYTVVRGTEVTSFDAEVLDVVDGDPDTDGPRILVRVSGPAVDGTGIGPGFSGSPIYCRDGDGPARNAGAISETVGQYGGKIVLATPIEAILGNPPEGPAPRDEGEEGGAAREDGGGAGRRDAGRAARGDAGGAARGDTGRAARRGDGRRRGALARQAVARARPLVAPLTVAGVGAPLGRALEAAGRRVGRAVLAAPAGPLGTFPPQALRPGSAVAVGYSSGDISVGAVGTVAYTDGDRVWAFGHPLEAVGRRALLLQDAYVYQVIDNPVQLGEFGATYKLAAPGHDLGTFSNDANAAVAGRTGGLPSTVPVRVFATDLDTGERRVTGLRVADETDVDTPEGGSPLAFVAPLAVTQAASTVLRSSPGRLTGNVCTQITVREIERPLRFCNRHLSAAPADPDFSGTTSVVAANAATDVFEALSRIDAYTGRPPHVTEVAVRIDLRRGQRQAYLRSFLLPRRARAGERIRVRATLQRVRGARFTRTYSVRLPRDLRRGSRRLTFSGRDVDTADDSLLGTIVIGDGEEDGGVEPGPGSLRELAAAIRSLQRFDGVRLRIGDRRMRAFRDEELRISGRASARIGIVRGRARGRR